MISRVLPSARLASRESQIIDGTRARLGGYDPGNREFQGRIENGYLPLVRKLLRGKAARTAR